MVYVPSSKRVAVTPPAAKIDDAVVVTAVIDRLGYDYCTVVVQLGDIDAAFTVLKIQESDSSGSGFTDVTGLIFGTSTNLAGDTSALPTASDDNDFFIFEIDLRGRKRYLDCVATVGSGSASTGAFVVITAELTSGETGPSTATKRAVNQVLQIPE